MDDFDAPAAAGGGITLPDYLGALLLIEVKSQEFGVITTHGSTDPISADIAVLDGTNKGDTFEEALIFPKVLIQQLKHSVGKKVLGRLGQGDKKPGQSPPWILTDPTDADREVGRAYVAAGFAKPTATATAPF